MGEEEPMPSEIRGVGCEAESPVQLATSQNNSSSPCAPLHSLRNSTSPSLSHSSSPSLVVPERTGAFFDGRTNVNCSLHSPDSDDDIPATLEVSSSSGCPRVRTCPWLVGHWNFLLYSMTVSIVIPCSQPSHLEFICKFLEIFRSFDPDRGLAHCR